jgi:hypothetical protein
MQLTPDRVGTEQNPQPPTPPCEPRCPVCSGSLIPLRMSLRCSRCYFVICEGCAGEPSGSFLAAAD